MATTSSMAWFTIRRRLVTPHKIWMCRSYGITIFTFVVSRVIGPVPFIGKMDFDTFTILLCFFWVPGLIVPEIILNYKEVFGKRKLVVKLRWDRVNRRMDKDSKATKNNNSCFTLAG
ncbi:MAG: DUF2306 domain-containing protein [Bacteroidota bacterium]|nr:DUF2306 domain-containing protein [Bacteroidota bacterium]